MKAKIKEGILLGIGISVGMLIFQVAMSLLSLAVGLLLAAGGLIQSI
jgi:hypothetical protein